MIHVEQKPLTDPEKNSIREWMSHPGRLLYQQFLMSQAAERQAKAANMVVARENPNEGVDESEAKALLDEARVFVASKKFLDEASMKDYNFYRVDLKPEPTTKQ